MKLGLFMQPVHDPARDVHQLFMDDLEIAVYLDELGYDEYWCGEHYAVVGEPMPSAMIFLANLIARTEKIMLGTGVIPLPVWHPAQVASHIAILDHLSEGRLMFGVASGGIAADWELFGAAEPSQMVSDSLDIILKLWSEDPPYNIEGKFWNVKLTENLMERHGVGQLLRPYQRPHPPIMIPAMSMNSPSMKFAGTRGYIPISSQLIPIEAVASHQVMYKEGCEAAGRSYDPEIWRVSRNVFVAESDSEAEAALQDPENKCNAAYYFEYIYDMVCSGGGKDYILPPKLVGTAAGESYSRYDYMRDNFIYGSPDTVVERLISIREEVGPFGTFIVSALDFPDRELHKRSLSLIAKEVMPRLGRMDVDCANK